nr:internal virion protein B-like protein [uncultured Mediterranean phage uvMED]
MSWQTAVVAAIGAAQYQQQGAIGKYNQAVSNRNAQVAEQEAQRLEQQLEFDLARFDQQFLQLQGQTKTRILKSGAELSGSGLRILRSNSEQAEIEKNVMDYNSKVAQSKKLEEANFARIKGTMARQSARLAQIGTIAQTGTSLLAMSGGGGGSPQGQFGSTANNSTFSNYS